MPVGILGVVLIACGERGVHEMRRQQTVGRTLRQQGDDVVALVITALYRAMADGDSAAGVVLHDVVHHPVDTVAPKDAVLDGDAVIARTAVGVSIHARTGVVGVGAGDIVVDHGEVTYRIDALSVVEAGAIRGRVVGYQTVVEDNLIVVIAAQIDTAAFVVATVVGELTLRGGAVADK